MAPEGSGIYHPLSRVINFIRAKCFNFESLPFFFQSSVLNVSEQEIIWIQKV